VSYSDLVRAIQNFVDAGGAQVLIYIIGGLVLVGLAVGKRSMTSIRRLGERTGKLEQAHELEHTRRVQVETELRRLGVRLPYWPHDPVVDIDELEPPRPAPRRDAGEDQQDDHTGHLPVTPAVPSIPRSKYYRERSEP
jgi:hypothetical protein